MKDWKSADGSEIVCYCKNIDKRVIVDSILSGSNNLQSIKETTTACTGGDCKELNPSGMCCSLDINELINLYSTNNDNVSCCCRCCRD